MRSAFWRVYSIRGKELDEDVKLVIKCNGAGGLGSFGQHHMTAIGHFLHDDRN